MFKKIFCSHHYTDRPELFGQSFNRISFNNLNRCVFCGKEKEFGWKVYGYMYGHCIKSKNIPINFLDTKQALQRLNLCPLVNVFGEIWGSEKIR